MKPYFPRDKALDDRYIEQFCQSVEKLLLNINNKSSSKLSKITIEEELRFMDHDEELIEY